MAEKGRRVFVRELIRYLNHPQTQVYRFLRRRGLLRWASLGHGHAKVPWVTEATALRVIAFCRAKQGELYLQGKDFHHQRAREHAGKVRERARRRALKAIASVEEREHGD